MGRHLLDLKRFYRGRIPPHELAYAERLDRTEARRMALAAAATAARTVPPSRVADAMARLMVDRASAGGACTDEDLRSAGFTVPEIARHRDQAAMTARRMTQDRIVPRAA